jgi:hypothetical protein
MQHVVKTSDNSQVSLTGPDDDTVALPSSGNEAGGTFSKILRAEQKRFFFDLGSNTRGQYLRISEVCVHAFTSHIP